MFQEFIHSGLVWLEDLAVRGRFQHRIGYNRIEHMEIWHACVYVGLFTCDCIYFPGMFHCRNVVSSSAGFSPSTALFTSCMHFLNISIPTCLGLDLPAEAGCDFCTCVRRNQQRSMVQLTSARLTVGDSSSPEATCASSCLAQSENHIT